MTLKYSDPQLLTIALASYATATPDTLQRRFLNSSGETLNQGGEIVVRLERKTYNPVLRQADLPVTKVPWWEGRTLRFEWEGRTLRFEYE